MQRTKTDPLSTDREETNERREFRSKKSNRKLKMAIICFVIAAGIACAGGWLYANSTKSPVPKNLSESVNFPVYYPDIKKLPNGYTLNKGSFTSPEKGVIIYSVNYGDGKKLIFSTQQQPSDSKIQSFYSNYIPLRNKMGTNLGEAEVGAYGTEKNLKTVVSLPTNNKTWLIITAPYDINQDQLKQVLNSLQK